MNYSAEFWGSVLTAFLVGAFSVGIVCWTTFRTKEVQQRSELVLEGISRPLNALASAGLVLDIDGKIVRATKTAFSLGLVRGEELSHPKLVALVDKARTVKKPSKARGRDLALVSELGKTTLWVNARAIHLGEGFVLLLVEDRTESHNLEETRRDFVANISHELKTPIGAISLLAEAIQIAVDDPQQVQKFAKSLEAESQRLAHLVQDIIQLSHVQSKEVAGLTKVVDLNGVLSEAIERNQVVATKKKVEIEVVYGTGVEVFGDDELLKAAVKNLIENAVLYSQENAKVVVTVRKRKGIAEVAVSDNGPGIAPEDQERIFERFYRVDPSRSRLTGGTGLGLSIVKHIAQKHLGEVQLKSKVGQGSTFIIRLPLAAQPIEVSK